MSRNQSLTKVVFVMPFIHIFKDPYKTSYQKSVILHFQTFSSNLLDFYIVSFPFPYEDRIDVIIHVISFFHPAFLNRSFV